ncbi:hypothetical protein GCM10027425_16220 [Alteromonas gracilis]
MLLALAIMLAHLVCPPSLTMARAAAAGAVGQVAVHVGLTALGGHDHGAGHGMTHEPATPFVEQLLAHGPGMLALHLLAAVGVALWLAHGERVALDLIALVLSRAAVLLDGPAPVVAAPAARPTEHRAVLLPPTTAHRRRHPHRGPPVALAA